MASNNSPQRMPPPLVAQASPACSGDKAVLPSDLMSLNDAEMVQLFEPGQQNGLFERYYQDVQGTISSTSSLSLANESFESLINDLDELSQPEFFVPVVAATAASKNLLGKEPALPQLSESVVSSTNVDSNGIDNTTSDSFDPDSSVMECVAALTSIVVEEMKLVCVKQSQCDIPVTEESATVLQTFTEVGKGGEVDSIVLPGSSRDKAETVSDSTSRVPKRQFIEADSGSTGASPHSTVPFKARKVAKKKKIPNGDKLPLRDQGVDCTPLLVKTVEIQSELAQDDVQPPPKDSVKSLTEYFESFVVIEDLGSTAPFGDPENTKIEEEVFGVVEKIIDEVSTAVGSILEPITPAPLSEQQCCSPEAEDNSTSFVPDVDIHPVQSLDYDESENKSDCSGKILNYHTCNICCLKFVRLVNLSRHMICHTHKEVHCCDSCDLICGSYEDLVAHNTELHGYSDGYTCKTCNFKVATRSELEEHVGNHLSQEVFICGECDSKFKRHSEFCLHSSQHTGVKVFGCSACDCIFLSKEELHSHESFSHSTDAVNIEKSSLVDKFQCEVCGELFEKLGLFNLHMSDIHGNWLPTCATCGRSFPKLKSLRTHWLRAHMDRPAFDKQLVAGKNKSVPDGNQQPAPQKRQFLSGKKPSPFECSDCEKHFHTSAVFLRHMSSHKRTRRSSLSAKFKIKVSSLSYKGDDFLCDICFAPFSLVSDLRRHISSMHDSEVRKYAKASTNSRIFSTKKQHVNLRGPEPGLILGNAHSLQDSGGHILESNNNTIEVQSEAAYLESGVDKIKTAPEGIKLILCDPYVNSESSSTVSSSLDTEPLVDHLCGQCSMSFNNHIEFVQHKQLHPLPLQCFICKSSFLIVTDLYSHSCITSD